MTPLVYSVSEAAEVLGISTGLVYRLVKNGTLPSVRLGDKRLVIPHRALEVEINRRAGLDIVEPLAPVVLDEVEEARWST